jgi:hypothetical protein
MKQLAKFPIVLILILSLFAAGCATDTGDPVKDRRARVTNAALGILGNFVMTTVANSLESAVFEKGTGEVNLAHSASAGVWKSVGSINVAADYAKIVDAYSGGTLAPAGEAIAKKVQSMGLAADDPKVTNTIASSISAAAINANLP